MKIFLNRFNHRKIVIDNNVQTAVKFQLYNYYNAMVVMLSLKKPIRTRITHRNSSKNL